MAIEEHLALLRQGRKNWNEWRGKNSNIIPDLSYANLSEANLSGANLSRANLKSTDLSYANLSEAYLSGANLSRADLNGTDLSYANLRGALLTGTDLSKTDLTGAILTGTDLSGQNLSKTDLTGAILSKTDLTGTDLSGALLSEAILSGAILTGTDLSGALLSEAILSEAILSGAILTGTDLSGALLSEAILTGTDLSGAILTGTDLTRADLSTARLIRTQALGTNFTAANFTGACLEDWHIDSATKLDDIDCQYVYLKSNEQERCPSSGEFAPGEFTKLFQKALIENFEHDVFISHASEDKDTFVRGLAHRLNDEGFHVWFDEFSLRVGDSLRRSIEKGLANSRYGIVVISPNFLNKEWPQRELDGLTARETDGLKVILPIWHKVNRKEVIKHFPTLADKLAVNTSYGMDYVVKKIVEVLRPQSRTELNNKDAQIARYAEEVQTQKEYINKLFYLLSQQQTVQKVMAENPGKVSHFNFQNPQFAGGLVDAQTVNAHQIGGNITNYTPEQRQNLAEAAAEIQQLLNQLAQTNPTTEVVTEAVYQEIKRNPTLKARLLAALKAGGLEALKAIFDNPIFSIPAETIKGWLEAE